MYTLGTEKRTNMNKIAVIMPVYKAHDTIKNTLMSIGMQRHVDYKLYMVVDGEPEGEYDYLKGYCDIDMEIYYMKENGGPAVARQFGIDFSTEPLISFIDADDTYLSSLSLYYQQEPLKEEKYAMVSCSFLQENKDHTLKLRERDMVWMHGKIYRRSYLDKYNIRFNDSRANEDVGFNTQCQCYANENEQVYLSHDVVYMWQWRDNSTVRTDNNAYAYNESINGYVENKIYAFESVLKQQEIDDGVKFFIMKGLAHLFKKYLLCMIKAPKQMRHVQKWSRKYYKQLYPLLDQEYIDKAEKTILAQQGLDKPEHYDEYKKWLDLLLHGKKKKR